MAANSTNLHDLNDDIWFMILGKLYQNGLGFLLPLSTVSRRFYCLAKPLIFKDVLIDACVEDYFRIYRNLLDLASADLKRYTLSLRVIVPENGLANEAQLDDTLCEIVNTCSRLQDLTWNGGQDISILTRQLPVQNWPSLRLHFNIFEASFDLANSLRLYAPFVNSKTLRMEIDKFEVNYYSQTMFDDLADIINQCRNLEILDIELIGDHRYFVDAFFFERVQTRFPALRNLTLTSYYWPYEYEASHDYWDFSRIERLRLLDVPLSNFIINSTFAKSDLSHLTELVLGDLKGGQLVSMLANSSEFELMQIKLDEIWRRASKLQSLSILKGWRAFCPLEAFQHFGHNLRELNLLLRKRNCEGSIWSEPKNDIVDMDDLDVIQAACPNLTKFHFATTMTGKTRWTHLELAQKVSAFRRLRDLRMEDEEFLGHDMAYGRWVNIPSQKTGFDVAKALMKDLINTKLGSTYRRIVIVTSGRYSQNDDYNDMYFRKYESNGRMVGFREYIGYAQEAIVDCTEALNI